MEVEEALAVARQPLKQASQLSGRDLLHQRFALGALELRVSLSQQLFGFDVVQARRRLAGRHVDLQKKTRKIKNSRMREV